MGILYIRDQNGNFVPVPTMKGPKGDSGVFVGDQTPTDSSVNVWVNPNGSASADLGNYYTKAETDAAISEATKENEYELIETITLEEAATVKRTAEPDGTPYKFKKFKMRVVSPASNQTSTYVNALIYSTTGERVIMNSGIAKGKRIVVWIELQRKKDTWDATFAYNPNESYGNFSYPSAEIYDVLSTPNAFGESIKELYINVALAAETIIQIWGVRA